jgi:hypothetical protein
LRLINERGSAAIMKERLSLAASTSRWSARMRWLARSTIRAQAAELRASNLEAEKLRLELDAQKLKEEIELPARPFRSQVKNRPLQGLSVIPSSPA